MRDLVFEDAIIKMNDNLGKLNATELIGEHWEMIDSVYRILSEFRSRTISLFSNTICGSVVEFKTGMPNQVFTIVRGLGKERYFRFAPSEIIAPVPISPLWKNRANDILKELEALSGMSVKYCDGVFTIHHDKSRQIVFNAIVVNADVSAIVGAPVATETKGDGKAPVSAAGPVPAQKTEVSNAPVLTVPTSTARSGRADNVGDVRAPMDNFVATPIKNNWVTPQCTPCAV